MTMNQEIDKELLHVMLEILQAALSSDKNLIDSAQQQLKVLQVRSEYSLILVLILVDQSCPFPVRQLACVLFKQYIEVHWSQNSDKFQEPEIDPSIKMRVKQLLPIGLSDQASKIRSSVAYSVARIGNWDWPDQWPELLDTLMSFLKGNQLVQIQESLLSTTSVSSQFNLNSVHGALETLIELVPELTDLQIPLVAPSLMPQLYQIFVHPQTYPIELRRSAIEIFTAITEVIADMCEYDISMGKKYLFPSLPDFTFAMIQALSLPAQESTNVIDNSLRKEIIKAFSILLKAFPKKLSKEINDILSQVWNCLVHSSQIYVNQVVNSDSADESSSKTGDAGEDEKNNFENLVYQLFEFILVLKENKKYKAIIKKAIDELCFYTVTYMQMTDEQIEDWTSSPENFVRDEDEDSYSYTVRKSALELLDTLASDFRKETANAVWKTIERQMQEAHKLKESGNPNWWKIQEACLVAVSTIKPILQQLSQANLLQFDLTAFVNQFVVASLHESSYPFLVGRALFTASCFPKLLNPETLETLLKATGMALQDNQNAIIRTSAMRAIHSFTEELTNENQQALLTPHLTLITEGLVNMITQNAQNQIGLLTMEALLAILNVNEQFVDSVESKVCPLAIALFLKNTNDPLVNSLVTDILRTLISNPYTNKKVESRLMPTLVSILNTKLAANQNVDEKNDFSSLLTSTLDLISMVIRSSAQVPLSDVTMSAFPLIINLCLKADDTALLQSGGECLRAYLSKSIEQVINWRDEKGVSALNYILMVLNHMLDPKTSESSCSYIGKFINTLIRQTANIIGDDLNLILKAVLSKMQSSNTLQVQQSLIMVFAQLIHYKMDPVLTFLSSLPGPTGQPVLDFLMTEWVAKQNSFVGPYDCKISILALAKILEHAVSTDDNRFQSIFVKGDRIINPIEGIKTRSKSKNEKELYTQVPLLVKIYKLLINELHSLIEERKEEQEEYDEDEDDEGEEVDEDDDDQTDENKEEIEVDESGNEVDNINSYLNKVDLFDEIFDREDLEDDDPEIQNDPLMKIDLLEFLTKYLQTLSQHPVYKVFADHHNNLEKEVLKGVGITNA